MPPRGTKSTPRASAMEKQASSKATPRASDPQESRTNKQAEPERRTGVNATSEKRSSRKATPRASEPMEKQTEEKEAPDKRADSPATPRASGKSTATSVSAASPRVNKTICGRADEPGVDGNRSRLFTAQRVFYEHVPGKYVTFLTPHGANSAMLVVGPSAVLTAAGMQPSELGLFAARPLSPGEVLGYYSGTVVEKGHRSVASANKAVDHRKLTSNKLLTFQLLDGEVVVIDGETAHAPYLSLINSPYRASRGGTRNREPTVENESLLFVVSRKRKKAIPGFRLDVDLSENRDCELLWHYGDLHTLRDEAKARMREAHVQPALVAQAQAEQAAQAAQAAQIQQLNRRGPVEALAPLRQEIPSSLVIDGANKGSNVFSAFKAAGFGRK